MKKNSPYLNYVLHDLLAGIEGITSKSMFGGISLYQYGIIFGIIIEDTLYFKVDDSNKQRYIELDSQPFTYTSKNNKTVQMPYWIVPEEILEDSDTLRDWVDASIAIARK